MLHLLISSLSPIITTMQATANSLGLLLPLWQILYLPLVFYSPLRINTDCPSNCNNPEFSVSAESNSCKQKTFITGHNNKKKMFLPIFSIVREVWWFLFGSMTQPVNCGKASWLSMTHIRYSTWAEMTKSALTASWHCWIQTFMFELCLFIMKSAGPAMTSQSKLGYLYHIIPKRRMQEGGVGSRSVFVNTSAQPTADEPAQGSLWPNISAASWFQEA